MAASASSSSKHPPVTPPSVSDVRSVVPPCCVGWLPGCPPACVGNFSHRRCSEVLSPPPLKPSSILSSPSAVPKVPQSEVGPLAALVLKVPQSKGGPPAVPVPKVPHRRLSLLRLLSQRLVHLLRPRRHQWLPRQL